jgi:hypothetical protein
LQQAVSKPGNDQDSWANQSENKQQDPWGDQSEKEKKQNTWEDPWASTQQDNTSSWNEGGSSAHHQSSHYRPSHGHHQHHKPTIYTRRGNNYWDSGNRPRQPSHWNNNNDWNHGSSGPRGEQQNQPNNGGWSSPANASSHSNEAKGKASPVSSANTPGPYQNSSRIGYNQPQHSGHPSSGPWPPHDSRQQNTHSDDTPEKPQLTPEQLAAKAAAKAKADKVSPHADMLATVYTHRI